MIAPKKLLIVVLLCFLLPAIGQSQQKHVTIRIGQAQTTMLDQFETEIVLQRKAFKIQVLLENVAGVFVFAAFNDSLCCRVTELDSIVGFTDLPRRTMQEPEYNKEKELLVNDDNSCSYWFYDKKKAWNGFNKKVVLLDDGRVVAVKTIKQVYYVPMQRTMKLKEMKTPLYLFFIAVSEFDDSGRPIKELLRKKVKITWIDED